MLTKHLLKVFIIRFIGYFAAIFGLLFILLAAEPVVGEELQFRFNKLFQVEHKLAPQVVTSTGGGSTNPQPSTTPTPAGGFGSLSFLSGSEIIPVSTEYGIVIEKINANAKVVPNVNPAVEREYLSALSQGVAASAGSTEPGQPGNIFIFSHSTDAPWNIVRYNAVFYLLKELEKDDRIVVFYNGRRYDYIVYDKTITDPSDVSFLTNRYDKPVLTLQTCDPPGTTLHRLLVRARLEGS
jgi:LPXTG-site transpeptidase (sortase) family protein